MKILLLVTLISFSGLSSSTEPSSPQDTVGGQAQGLRPRAAGVLLLGECIASRSRIPFGGESRGDEELSCQAGTASFYAVRTCCSGLGNVGERRSRVTLSLELPRRRSDGLPRANGCMVGEGNVGSMSSLLLDTLILPPKDGSGRGSLPPPSPFLKDGQMKNSTILYIAGGTAVASGAAAAYFKITADAHYREYRRTNNSATLTRVRRLDILAGVSLVISEFSIFLLYYLLLSR